MLCYNLKKICNECFLCSYLPPPPSRKKEKKKKGNKANKQHKNKKLNKYENMNLKDKHK